jgi:hypothetical protein
MRELKLMQVQRGYILRDDSDAWVVKEMYAFSTLKELRDFLPELLEPKKTKQPGDASTK